MGALAAYSTGGKPLSVTKSGVNFNVTFPILKSDPNLRMEFQESVGLLNWSTYTGSTSLTVTNENFSQFKAIISPTQPRSFYRTKIWRDYPLQSQ
jgi:hypothetical protein